MLISESIASLPIEAFNEQNGIREHLPDDDTAYLVGSQPSPLYDSYKWRLAMMVQTLLYGNAISLIRRDERGAPIELRVVDVSRVQPVIDGAGDLFFKIYGDAKSYVVEATDALHIAFNPTAMMGSGIMWGQNPLQIFKDTLSFNINTTKYGDRIFKKGTHFKGFLTTDQSLSKDAAKSLRDLWDDWYSGVENFGVTPLLHSGLKWQGANITPEDAMFDKTRSLNVSDISNIYGVPPHMLANLDRATYNNAEQQNIEFVTYVLRPWVKQWEGEMRSKLTPEKLRRTRRMKFNLTALLRGSTEARSDYYRTMIQGIMTPNEIRRLEGLNPVDGGDKLLIPMNMQQPDNGAQN